MSLIKTVMLSNISAEKAPRADNVANRKKLRNKPEMTFVSGTVFSRKQFC